MSGEHSVSGQHFFKLSLTGLYHTSMMLFPGQFTVILLTPNLHQALKHVQYSDGSVLIFNCYQWPFKCEISFMDIVFFIKQIHNFSRGAAFCLSLFDAPSLIWLDQSSVSCIGGQECVSSSWLQSRRECPSWKLWHQEVSDNGNTPAISTSFVLPMVSH